MPSNKSAQRFFKGECTRCGKKRRPNEQFICANCALGVQVRAWKKHREGNNVIDPIIWPPTAPEYQEYLDELA